MDFRLRGNDEAEGEMGIRCGTQDACAWRPACPDRALAPHPGHDDMTDLPYMNALIVGAGPGISASVARALSAAGLKVAVAARHVEKLQPLAAEIGAEAFA